MSKKWVATCILSTIALGSYSFADTTSYQTIEANASNNDTNQSNNFVSSDNNFSENKTISKAPYGLVLGLNGGYAGGFTTPDENNNRSGNIYGGGIVGFDFALNDVISFGGESGYDYGYKIFQSSDNNSSTNFSVIPVLGTLKFTLPMGINLFAKGGMAYVMEQTKISGETHNNKAWKPMAAAGVGYVYDNWNLFAQYSYIFGNKEADSANNNEIDHLGMVTAGVTYTFPLKF